MILIRRYYKNYSYPLPVHRYLYGDDPFRLECAYYSIFKKPKLGLVQCGIDVLSMRENGPFMIVGGKDALKRYMGKFPRVTSYEFPNESKIGLALPSEARTIDLPRYCITRRSYSLCGGYLWKDYPIELEVE